MKLFDIRSFFGYHKNMEKMRKVDEVDQAIFEYESKLDVYNKFMESHRKLILSYFPYPKGRQTANEVMSRERAIKAFIDGYLEGRLL